MLFIFFIMAFQSTLSWFQV